MTLIGRYIAQVAVILACAGIVTASLITPALAVQQQICDQSDPGGYCLNDWFNGGSGTAIKLYNPNVSNENFAEQSIQRCGGIAVVTPTCPFADTAIDSTFIGDPIVQVKYYGSAGGCMGLTSAASGYKAVNLGCNSTSTGSGGGFGTAWVDDVGGHLVSVGATNGSPDGLDSWCSLVGEGFQNQPSVGLTSGKCDRSASLWSGIQ